MYFNKYKSYKNDYHTLKAGSNTTHPNHKPTKNPKLIGLDGYTLPIPDYAIDVDDLSSFLEREIGTPKGNIDIMDPSIHTPLPSQYPIKTHTDYYYSIKERSKIERGEKIWRDKTLLQTILDKAMENGYLDSQSFNYQLEQQWTHKVYMIPETDSNQKELNIPFTLVICQGFGSGPETGIDHWSNPHFYQVQTRQWIIHTYFDNLKEDEETSSFPKHEFDHQMKLVPFDEIEGQKLHSKENQVFQIQEGDLTPL